MWIVCNNPCQFDLPKPVKQMLCVLNHAKLSDPFCHGENVQSVYTEVLLQSSKQCFIV